MSLLVTSCTMSQQPDRLLNKGPQYLRTRTNASLFGQHRQSAVELLAASKAHFYNSRNSVPLDKHQDLAVTVGQHQRYGKNNNRISSKQKEPPRSKSEYDLTLPRVAFVDDGSDANNNTSDDPISFSTADVDNCAWLNLKDDNRTKHINNSEIANESVLAFNSFLTNGNALNFVSTATFNENSSANHNPKPQPQLTILQHASSTTLENEQIYENVAASCMPPAVTDEVDCKIIKKPIPLPRKSKEKPVPPPRKLSFQSPTESTKDSNVLLSETTTSPLTVQSPSLPSRFLLQKTPQINTHASLKKQETDFEKQYSVVDCLAKQFTTLSATAAPLVSDKHQLQLEAEKDPEIKVTPQTKGTFTATPIFISKEKVTSSQSFHAKRIFITENCVRCSSVTPKTHHRVLDTFYVNNESIEINRNRKRCPDVSASARAVKRERRSTGSDTSYSKPGFINSLASILVSPGRTSSSTSKSEMSIESADQAVCESEINATASMEAENLHGQDGWAREVTRSNSTLSGKMEPQDMSPLSASPTPHTLVPRSHSDISCCLESRHSRDSSLVSNHSRLSRASIGTDLENFFNQMGLEKSVLEPMNRLRELQAGEVFDSMSSFDSQDAISIYSHSEQECNDSQFVDRSQQQTSVVERNARIIKWLCNVRKAKIQPQKQNSPAISKT